MFSKRFQLNSIHFLFFTIRQETTVTVACSKRPDSGEQCEVKKAMKSRRGPVFEATKDAYMLVYRPG